MKSWFRFLGPLTVVALLFAVVLSSDRIAAAQPDEEGDSKHGQLEGTWRVQVTLRDCDTGAALTGPFQSLLTFARGGTLTETTSNPMFSAAQRSPGHGVWNRIGGHEYSAASIALITVNGVLVQTQTIRQKIQIGDNPDQLNSDAKTAFFDPAGNLVRSGCATAVGQRFE